MEEVRAAQRGVVHKAVSDLPTGESMSLIELAKETGRDGHAVADASGVVRSGSAPEQLFGYQVIGQLGRGAGSVVYEVRDARTGRRHAMKHVVVGEQKHLRFIEQLEREHEVGQAVRHEGLRLSLALHVKRNLLRRITEAALVMELVEGWPIAVPMPAEQALGYLVQVSRSLAAIHAAGFVHCDLKPQNLLVDRALHVKLIDLGQACRIGTVKERVQGTPDFISPEQVKCLAVTPRTDVYNFGATAYCLLTGSKIPTLFTVKKGGANSFLLDDRVTPPQELDPQVPALLSALVMHCIALNPEQRPEMSDVTRRLEAIQYSLSRSTGQRARRAATGSQRA